MNTRRLAVFNNKGGCGKSSSVINIAYFMQRSGHKVLVVDCDTQENCFMFFLTSHVQDTILPTDYANLSDEAYKASLDKALSADTVIQSVEKKQGDGNMHVIVLFSYPNERGKMEVTEHIFITDKYIFEMVYAEDPEADWKKAFAESEAELRLLNVARQ